MGVVDDAGNRVSSVRRVSRGVTAGAVLTPGELGRGCVMAWGLLGVVAGRTGGVASSSTLVFMTTGGPCADGSISKTQK